MARGFREMTISFPRIPGYGGYMGVLLDVHTSYDWDGMKIATR